MTFNYLAWYHFEDLPAEKLPLWREAWLADANQRGLRGSVLLAEEGVNAMLAGEGSGPEEFSRQILQEIGVDPQRVPFKKSLSTLEPFRRMFIKIKKEIIPIEIAEIRPQTKTAPRLSPHEFKQWLDSNRDMVVLDTRNAYEIRVGTFEKAAHLELKHFRHFPKQVRNRLNALKKDWQNRPIVTFCTGGIRCEKASEFLLQEGFKDVYQLDGGILNYFKEVGGDHYRGDCFVFDQRVALNPDLQATDVKQCFYCREPLLPEEQKDPRYQPDRGCPYCLKPFEGP